MKKVFNYFLALGICLMGLQVNVKASEPTTPLSKTAATDPVYVTDGGKDFFIANGTPVTIEMRADGTYAIWSGGSQKLTEYTIVVGGAYDTWKEGENISIDYESTSVTMNSGKVGAIVGGNAIVSNYDKYDKVHVGTINVDINGGEVRQVAGVSPAFNLGSNSNISLNVALGSDYYKNIKTYYAADKVNINVDDAKIPNRIYICSSYTYAKDAVINVKNSDLTGDKSQGIFAGTNGVVDNLDINVDSSKVSKIHASFRAMVTNMSVNAKGNTTIGDIFAGSDYELVEQYNGKGWFKSDGSPCGIGDINYGQVASMDFTLGENVKYNNIYAGFQYVDQDVFFDSFKDASGNLPIQAQGLANSKTAKLVINVASSPLVNDSKLKSMLKATDSFVKVNYIKEVEVEVTNPNDKVDVPTIGILDKANVETIINKIIETNTEILEYVKQGIDVDVKVETKKVDAPANKNEFVTVFKEQAKDVKLASFFDISINVLDKGKNNKVLTSIEQIDSKMNLSVILPDELKEVAKGFERKFFVLREHNGKIEILDSVISKDGKYISFGTDKFSTYALAYVDTAIKVEQPFDKPNVDKPNVDKPNIDNPNTYDGGIMNNLMFIVGGLLLAVGSVTYLRKELKSNK